jgi:hypothetical protein
MHLGQRFLVHQWSDGCAVFDQFTGNTHSLDALACAGFVAAQRNESPYQALADSIRALHPDKSAAEVTVLVNSCFERLEQSGLIEVENKN